MDVPYRAPLANAIDDPGGRVPTEFSDSAVRQHIAVKRLHPLAPHSGLELK
jgi:hypothetical protein